MLVTGLPYTSYSICYIARNKRFIMKRYQELNILCRSMLSLQSLQWQCVSMCFQHVYQHVTSISLLSFGQWSVLKVVCLVEMMCLCPRCHWHSAGTRGDSCHSWPRHRCCRPPLRCFLWVFQGDIWERNQQIKVMKRRSQYEIRKIWYHWYHNQNEFTGVLGIQSDKIEIKYETCKLMELGTIQ